LAERSAIIRIIARMMRKICILITPLVLLVLIELAFRLGVWEPLAMPLSHAGTSVRLKRNLLDPAVAKLDYVTLGSSRPEYGIDHKRISEAAKTHGLVHANLSMPGTHWMSIGVLTDWLREHHPEIRGGIIALSSQSLGWPSNGYYELGIVQPFRRSSDDAWIAAHVPLESDHIESFGSRFALFAWRDDVRDFLVNPVSRLNRFRKTSRQADPQRLFENPDMPGDMCAWGLDSLDACRRLEEAADASPGLRIQCEQVKNTVEGRPDFEAMASQIPIPEFMRLTRELIQHQLREIKWPTPPVVVLMPTPPIWRNDAHGEGLQKWALSILKPLEDDGTIRLIDATRFFDEDARGGCEDFGDFYHQNSKGRQAFSDWLMAKLDEWHYYDGEQVRKTQ
jgi:hypothetical protein